MASIQPQQIDELKQLLSNHHSEHEQQRGPVHGCNEPSCVEAKLGLRYLGDKIAPAQDSGSSTFNLK